MAVLLDEALEVLGLDEVQRLARRLVVPKDDDEGEGHDVEAAEEARDGERRALGAVVDVRAREAKLELAADGDRVRVEVAGGVAVGVQANLAEDLQECK